ncbi:hypothetical protein [Natrialbaceae archaeon AArc-T1-2]|uniref:hypothetical protein n=1 Tax=Natrialbaceae archaeon AArc-T1-2 TaxID=3053904 RepID=UPI00255AFBBE|nr:hypothetical protein [Natrialbaceae archaeon AArc-T1-2]WIV66007.1 hypothetical protein QQ977_09895 [Natrialbaceae archaeon AArc-T1-2]
MPSIGRLLSSLVASAIAIAVMAVFATVVFAVTIFVVSTGANLAGYSPSADYVVLSSALIVVAVILTGGLTPGLSRRGETEPESDESTDRMYG